MEILFKNNYIRDKAVLKEVYQYYFSKLKRFIVCYSILILLFFVRLVRLILGYTYNYDMLIYVPLVFAFFVFYYFQLVNISLKRDKENYGQNVCIETIVTDEYVQREILSGNACKIAFDAIKRADQTKHFIVLFTKARQLYIFKKDSFSIGDKEQFISFLKAKGITVKGR